MKDKDRLIDLDSKHLVHPLTHPKHFDHHPPRIIVDGSGVMMKDIEGRDILDGFASLWCVAVEHNHPKIIERKQIDRIVDTLDKSIPEMEKQLLKK